MRLVSAVLDGHRRAGILDGDEVFVTEVAGLDAALAGGRDLRSARGRRHRLGALSLDAPLRPPVVFCCGQNFRDHLDEKAPVEVEEPEFFLKAGQTIAAPGEPAVLDPRVTAKLDYETELGVVIGRRGRHVARERALDHVAGYVVVNDLTARDRQVVVHADGSTGMALGPGKNFDGALRMAAWMTTADDVADPQRLALRTLVSGELRQANTTAAMIFDVMAIVAFVSRMLTLEHGAVIATGTPGGTGWGQDPELGGTGRTPEGCVPGRYLRSGDTVESEVEAVGRLAFDVTA
jgi:2-keto-4-pentenoate hydratase/2-oxohepta-3-ene-1,7-dioic acid hydratase in catechol pathway